MKLLIVHSSPASPHFLLDLHFWGSV